jgi:hypothetical protein
MFVKRMMRDYDLVDKKSIWNLAPPLVRAYLFLTVHLDRNAGAVPLEMTKEYRETLRLAPVLAEEFVKASCVPRNKYYQVRTGLDLLSSSLLEALKEPAS